jgi:hypothetical protein
MTEKRTLLIRSSFTKVDTVGEPLVSIQSGLSTTTVVMKAHETVGKSVC